ncbi:MAG: Miniconductance mechanosensitive channel [Lachnoclostridium sp.]|jgi:miniconductance mechanosensitive channel
MEYFKNLFVQKGMNPSCAFYLSGAIMIMILAIFCIVINLISVKIILKFLALHIENTKNRWDNIMLKRRVFHRLVLILPGIVAYNFAQAFLNYEVIMKRISVTYISVIAIMVLDAVLDSINEIYQLYPVSKVRPMKGLIQIVKIIIYIVSGIIIVANLMGQSPIGFLGGIGALTAIFSLVFKDSILGFVAGIQLTSNNMLRIGDWIEMERYGADGEVVEITLNTVKVQNSDHTIVTIPAYALVSDSFKNWRGMIESGGRRIKRAVYIDTTSIGFCTEEMLEKFKQIRYLRDYILRKEEEMKKYKEEHGTENDLPINGMYLTNIGAFRAYISNYIENCPGIHKGMSRIVRHLPPGEFGLPLEIYAYTRYTDWASYENLQADIFDHILSVASEFGLRIFQNPTGQDLRMWGRF